MQVPQVLIAVVVGRTPLASRWVSERWECAEAEVVPAALAAEVVGSPLPGGDRWRYAAFAAELQRSEAEGYYLNITAPEPKLFVLTRPADDGKPPPVRPVLVTLSYNAAARMLDGGEQVDAVPMPPGVVDWMRPFVAEHYRPEPRKKVRRNDPFAADAAAPADGRWPQRNAPANPRRGP